MSATLMEPSVAKKKNDPPKSPRKPMVVQVRGSEAWKAWADAMAEKEGDTLAQLVDRALRKWAKDYGHPEPPKR